MMSNNLVLDWFRIDKLKCVDMIISSLLHALVDIIDLLSRPFHVQFVIWMRLEHFEISRQLWKLLLIDRKQKVEHEQGRPDTEIGQCHDISCDESVSAFKESLNVPICTDHSIDLIFADCCFASIANRILKIFEKFLFEWRKQKLTQISKSLANK